MTSASQTFVEEFCPLFLPAQLQFTFLHAALLKTHQRLLFHGGLAFDRTTATTWFFSSFLSCHSVADLYLWLTSMSWCRIKFQSGFSYWSDGLRFEPWALSHLEEFTLESMQASYPGPAADKTPNHWPPSHLWNWQLVGAYEEMLCLVFIKCALDPACPKRHSSRSFAVY